MDSMTLLMIGSKLIGLQLKGFHFCTFLCDVGWFPSRWKNTTGKWQCEKGRERKCKSSRACFKDMWADAVWSSCRGKVTRNFKQGLLETFTTSQDEKTQNPGAVLFLCMAAWLPGGSYFLEHSCAPLHSYTFRRTRKDDRLSWPQLVLILHPAGLELRTLGSQASHPNHERQHQANPGAVCYLLCCSYGPGAEFLSAKVWRGALWVIMSGEFKYACLTSGNPWWKLHISLWPLPTLFQ